MTLRRALMLLVAGGLFAGLAGFGDVATAGDTTEGEALVRQAWALMKANDVKAVDKLMAPGFQSAHSDGARDKAAEPKLIAGLKLSDLTQCFVELFFEKTLIILQFFDLIKQGLYQFIRILFVCLCFGQRLSAVLNLRDD